MKKFIKSEEEWKKILSEEEYYVTRQKGTEPAFSGKAFDITKDGIFKCRCCGAELLRELLNMSQDVAGLVFSRRFQMMQLKQSKILHMAW